MPIILDNIDQLGLVPIMDGRAWRVSFRSANAGMCHQLYANGRLAAWTDAPSGRQFVLSAAAHGRQLVVAAVEPAMRAQDLSAELPAEIRQPTWVVRVLVDRPEGHSWRSAALLGDGAGGGPVDRPLATADGAGQDESATCDGSRTDGLGLGHFGLGQFGKDLRAVELSAALHADGVHRLVVRCTAADGRTSDGSPRLVEVHPPPLPPTGIRLACHDVPGGTVTLLLE